MRKGIILASDCGGELYPATQVIAKSFLPIHNKPMIYYPLSTLILMGIRDILIVSAVGELRGFMELLGNGRGLGLRISYAEQPEGAGISQSLVGASRFIGDDSICVIRGDNICHGDIGVLRRAAGFEQGASIFLYDPRGKGKALCEGGDRNINQEQSGGARPPRCSSGLTRLETVNPAHERGGAGQPTEWNQGCVESWHDEEIAGLYLLDNRAVEIAAALHAEPCLAAWRGTRLCSAESLTAERFDVREFPIVFCSAERDLKTSLLLPLSADALPEQSLTERSGKEIADIAHEYSVRGELRVWRARPECLWLEPRTPCDMREATNQVAEIEKREGGKVGCIEEAALRMGFISGERLERVARDYPSGGYREHLLTIARRSE